MSHAPDRVLYHGSAELFDKIDVNKGRPRKDFGRGFYVTPVYEQAVKWAERFKDAGDKAYLSVYDLDESVLAGLKVLDFPDHSGEWLDFIVSCRMGNDVGGYDVVRGGVANDKVFDTCELYFRGLISKETAIDRLKFTSPNLQLCFKNNRTIRDTLFFSDSITL